ncbi:hypothetical protein AMTR_s00235p00020530 [Amborella trichopoda]|uniref:Uncharacterized protein n=1 Tax=Amborella trichopoda TaxID=13333 RepID=W1NQZ4_AMBTC|nr:hypothetical protein AMTR_s00235p00020530 [Amborella trichopoda]
MMLFHLRVDQGRYLKRYRLSGVEAVATPPAGSPAGSPACSSLSSGDVLHGFTEEGNSEAVDEASTADSRPCVA